MSMPTMVLVAANSRIFGKRSFGRMPVGNLLNNSGRLAFVPAYAIGTVAMYWLIERTTAIIGWPV